ncbi:diphthine--ammonia ligase isoform X1 [Bufo bufo]|uniref:diphthine--ammonia ligase isoform X1 n=1 Tax=Bufo bufo TaxID=8384 RepID=UPI001ABE5318|nr:diphthine--ammonia ligase isoform X1 [Bufo bufo]
MRVVALISGGKDSCYNMMQCAVAGHQIVALANLKPPQSSADELDSYMYQTVGHQALDLYAEAMALPLYRVTLSGSSLNTGREYKPQEGDEVEDLYRLLKLVKEKEAVDSVSVGAILSDYQRVRVENVCQRLGLQPLAFLWRRKQEDLLNEMISSGLHAILIKVAAFGLDPDKHLGKSLEEMRPHLMQLSARYGVHVCGEGGEYETLTLDCPLFKKKIVVDSSEVVMHSNDAFAPVAYLRVAELHLEDKVGSPALVSAESCPCDTVHLLSDDTAMNREVEKQPMSFIPQARPSGKNLDIVVQQSSQSLNGFRWISEIAARGSDVREVTRTALSSLKAQVQELSLEMSDAVLVHLYVRNMDDFASINTEYAALFPSSPPARVCVQCCLPQDTLLKMDALFWQQPVICSEDWPPEKIAMHVQSISHWAPANIGPYSQAVRVGGAVFCAGQIALIPCTMQLIPGGIMAESSLSLRHVDRVLDAICPGTSRSHVMVAHCYVTQSSYIRFAQKAWESSAENEDAQPALTVAVVPRLPRGAVVEWHVMASVSDPDDRRNISVAERSSGFQVTLNGSISSCETCASLILSLSRPAPQTDSLDWCNVSQLVKTVLHKAFNELPKNFPLIPVCCRVFYRTDSMDSQTLTAGFPEILREVCGEKSPCLVLVPVIELSFSEHLTCSMWFSS